MNNTTVKNYCIKVRGDHVYDLYVNGVWYTSCGCYKNALHELEKIMEGMPYESNS